MPNEVTDLARLERQVDQLRVAFVTLLIWMSGSAASPLRADELQRLVHMAEGTEEKTHAK